MNQIITIFLLLSICKISFSQLAVRASANVANLKSTANSNVDFFEPTPYESEISYSVGLSYLVKLKKIELNPELNFVNNKMKYPDEIYGSNIKRNLSFSYVQVPIFIRKTFINKDSIPKFHLKFGPYLGLGVGSIVDKVCVDGNCESTELAYGKETLGFRNPDFGLTAGVGLNINRNLSLDIRYLYGLMNLNNLLRDSISTRNYSINVGLIYSIF